jgi:alpha-beta hydrolase superfamily lysophospholipase
MLHVESKFTGIGNTTLHSQSWLLDGPPKAVFIIVHGLAEHSGRYMNPVNYFVPKGYAIYTFDLRGHGKSAGTPGYVDHFSDYLSDLKIFSDKVRTENDNAKIFLIGHSMGGTIAVAYAVEHQNELAGLITSGAVLKAGSSVNAVSKILAKVLSVLMPKMGVSKLDSSTVSRDKAVVEAYVKDPLDYTGKISARLGAELLKEIDLLPSKIPQITLPILIMHGAADRLSDPASSKMLFDGVGSRDKTLKLYEGFYHEIFNDPEREKVFTDMETWLNLHL